MERCGPNLPSHRSSQRQGRDPGVAFAGVGERTHPTKEAES